MRPYISKTESPLHFAPKNIQTMFKNWYECELKLCGCTFDVLSILRNEVRDDVEPFKGTLIRIIRHRRI
jgi:hypothetical protein